MSLPDGAKPRTFSLLGLALLTLVLSGCYADVHPLYGGVGGNGVLAAKLQSVAVDPISSRLGHYLGDDLVFAMNGTGSTVTPKYHLIVQLYESSQTPLIDTVTGLASSATVVTTAEFRLVPVAGTEPIYKAKAYVAASYDRTSNRYADVRAARDAEIRDAKTLADQIQTLVATELATRT